MPTVRSRFRDKHGDEVCVGDRVRGIGVNEHLHGTVVQLDSNPAKKPFVVRTDDGQIVFMNESWIEKDPRKE